MHPQQCTHCGGADLEATGTLEDHVVADIPEPKIDWHRYRRHIYRCRTCQKTCQGRGDLELPGAHIGPRARLLTCYARAHLGISLGKTQNLLHDYFGLTVSRAGLLGHLRWGGTLFAPVVEQLWDILPRSPVVQGDETGWRIDGQPVYHGLDCPKQRCLVHLLRELAKLREELPGPSVRTFIQSLIVLFQDAIQLARSATRWPRPPSTRVTSDCWTASTT